MLKAAAAAFASNAINPNLRLAQLSLQGAAYDPGSSCDRFLPVVTGSPPSWREGGAEVDEMLDRFSPCESTDDQNGPRH